MGCRSARSVARVSIMETLSPLGPVFHAGTLAGNPLATAAGLAALNELDGDVYVELTRSRRPAGVDADRGLRGGGVPCPVPGRRLAARHVLRRTARPPVDFAGAKRTDEAAYARFFHAMLAEGVAMAPGAYEALFVGLAHTDDVLDADRRSRGASREAVHR